MGGRQAGKETERSEEMKPSRGWSPAVPYFQECGSSLVIKVEEWGGGAGKETGSRFHKTVCSCFGKLSGVKEGKQTALDASSQCPQPCRRNSLLLSH